MLSSLWCLPYCPCFGGVARRSPLRCATVMGEEGPEEAGSAERRWKEEEIQIDGLWGERKRIEARRRRRVPCGAVRQCGALRTGSEFGATRPAQRGALDRPRPPVPSTARPLLCMSSSFGSLARRLGSSVGHLELLWMPPATPKSRSRCVFVLM